MKSPTRLGWAGLFADCAKKGACSYTITVYIGTISNGAAPDSMENKMAFSLYGTPEANEFKVGDRVKRASDGKAGVITADTKAFHWRKGEPKHVEVKWDSSGSKSVRPVEGLVRE